LGWQILFATATGGRLLKGSFAASAEQNSAAHIYQRSESNLSLTPATINSSLVKAVSPAGSELLDSSFHWNDGLRCAVNGLTG